MRVAALVLAIIGGLIGLLGACLVAGIGVLGTVMGFGYLDVWHVVFGFFAAILGIVGGGLAMTRPAAAAIVLVVATVLGLVGIECTFGPSAVLFIAAAVVAWLGRREVVARQAG